MSIVVRFCGPDDKFKHFYHDDASEDMEIGDIVFDMSLVNRQFDYRVDHLLFPSFSVWQIHQENVR